MPDIEYCRLAKACQPLLDKFYRAHRSPMRSSGAAQMWVAKQQEIVGALCLTPVTDGHWLTGLFIAPEWRGQSVARTLISSALEALAGPVWLFCHPELLGFYEQSGFALTENLPPALADKLTRYSRTKVLVAMVKTR
jgi:GNAT superfamily N-acetyltransferase